MQPRPATEDHVAGEFDLGHRPLVVEPARGALAGTEPRGQARGPVAGTLPQDLLVEAVGCGPQLVGVGAAHDRVVVHLEPDPGAPQLLCDVGVSVQEAAHGERQIGRDTQAHRPHDRVQDVEVVVEKALGGAVDDPIVVTARRGVARFVGDEGRALFHAFEDDDHTALAPERTVVGRDEFLLAGALRRRQDGNSLLFGIALQPRAVARRPPRQHGRRDSGPGAALLRGPFSRLFIGFALADGGFSGRFAGVRRRPSVHRLPFAQAARLSPPGRFGSVPRRRAGLDIRQAFW